MQVVAPLIPKIGGVDDCSQFDDYKEVPLVVGKEMGYADAFADF